MRHGRTGFSMLLVSALAGTALAGGVTTTTTTTTTSTSLPPACTDEVSFDSANCRLDELAAAVAAEPALGGLATKLGNALGKADSNVNLGGEQCDAAGKQTESNEARQRPAREPVSRRARP